MPTQDEALKKLGQHEVVKRHDDGDLTVKGQDNCLYVVTTEGESFREVGCGAKSKRVPSAYQRFIGDCMKSKHIKGFGQAPAAMRECAAAWRAQKS
jgi:hypothetical protein